MSDDYKYPEGPIQPEDILPGDRLRLTRVTEGDVLRVSALTNEVHWKTTPAEKLIIERVALAKPRKGAVLTADLVRKTWWKRGSIIKVGGTVSPTDRDSRLVLLASGQWINIDSGIIVPFERLVGPFTVERVA